jgi:hypothetical protein
MEREGATATAVAVAVEWPRDCCRASERVSHCIELAYMWLNKMTSLRIFNMCSILYGCRS